MNVHAIHMVFSPQSCPLDLLDATLTNDRRVLAERLLQQIRSDISRKTASHTLIIGPRGSGKTHLLAFVRKTLEESAAVASELLIIPLAEEEHGMTTLLDFLIAALRACRHDVRVLNPDFGAGGREIALGNAINAFEGVARGKSILILVENLGSIFAALESGEVDRLRAFFQSHPRSALLASAVELFVDSARPDHPFHGFFSIEPLRPLKRKEARAYLAQLAGAKGDKDLEAQIRARGAGSRVDAIYDLTGGNHRLLAMLSTFLTVAGFAELVGPFVQMVDRELTPYYQHRLDRLSPQQKKILMCIADHHGRALSVKEIAQYAFSTSQIVSRQLADLQHGAFVHRTKVGKESLYELNEPLLRLVLDIKEGRDRPLPLIVAFLRRWHGLRELQQIEDQAPANIKAYYTSAIEQEISLRDSIAGERHASSGVARFQLVPNKDPKPREVDEISDLLARSHALENHEQLDQAIAICDEVVQRFGSSDQPELMKRVAWALVGKGFALSHLNRSEEEIAAYDEVVLRFGSSDQFELLEEVAGALVHKGLTLNILNRFEEGIAAYDQVVRRFASRDRPELLEHVARALLYKGSTLRQLERSEEAIAVYDEVVQRFGSSHQPGLLQPVAKSLAAKASWELGNGHLMESLALSERALSIVPYHPDAIEVRIRTLFRVGKVTDALKFLRDCLSKIETADPLRNKLVTLALEESHVDGGALRELVEIYRETPEPLSLGLLRWIQDQLPMSEARARALEKGEQVLTESFGQLPECSLALQVLSAARRHALGDRQALFSLPLEIRRLVANEPE